MAAMATPGHDAVSDLLAADRTWETVNNWSVIAFEQGFYRLFVDHFGKAGHIWKCIDIY